MEKIKFSIIIPVYNVEDYLERCVESVENQNYSNIEVLLIDDGSTDSSPTLCDELANKYSNIKVFHKQNGGLSDARNYGILKATGDYLVLLDSDDYISVTACKDFFDALSANDVEPDIIAANVVKHKGDESIMNNRTTSALKIITGAEFLLNELKNNTYFVEAVASVYNRKFLIENGLFFDKGKLHEDEDFTPRAYLTSDKVINSNIAFYHYVIRENSITTKKNKTRNAVCIFEICRNLNEIYDKVDNPELKTLLKTHSAKICFKAIEDARLYKKESRHIIDIPFLKKNCFFKKEKLRFLLLNINPWLLHWFTNIKKAKHK